MADAKLTALTAASALAGADLFYISQGGVSKKATHTQLLTLVGTTYVPLAGNATMTGALTIASGTLTASAPALNITQTWNAGAVQFNSLLINITDSASSSISTFFEMQVAGTVRHLFTKGGRYTGASAVLAGPGASSGVTSTGVAINNFGVGIRNSSLSEFSWTSGNLNGTVDLALYRDAAATLAQRNGTTAQTLLIYGTADGSPGSNYQRMVLSANGTTGVTIAAEGLGTPGANQNITLAPAGSGQILSAASMELAGVYLGTAGVNGRFTVSGSKIRSDALAAWSSTTNVASAADAGIGRNAAGVLEVNSGTAGTYRDLKLRNLLNTEYHQMTEMTAPAAPATNSVRIYAEDNGAGKTRLMALFATGAAQQIAIEP